MEVENADDASTVASLLPLACVSQQPYVSELLSFTLDRLHKEPELLRVDAERIQRQMQEVAVGNYRAFIAAADALLAIREEVTSIDKHLESLNSSNLILEERKMNQTLLANHSALLDLLEIPQLMDTCVRNGNYDEALDLEAFVCKLSTMHPKLPVIPALAAEVRHTTQSLLAVLNLFSKNMSTAVENFQLVLDSHRWVPLPAIGFPTNSLGEENQEDVTPPSYLMEHPPLAVFVNELIKGLKAVSDSLLRYNATRMLRENESGLFSSLCRSFIEVAYPHCATCFDRCYPGGTALIMDAKNLYNGIDRLLATSPSRELPRPVNNPEEKVMINNGDMPVVENGVSPNVEQTQSIIADEKEQKSPTLQTDEKQTDA
ncbi:hypothetical protein P3X46_007434 [Hevea brasiliensis]|uniref:Conserved oligomeric Golgi complex subunit 8 n=1 Tax=Hevea brasiliensis TaxID=3981 RepID=A0ABQ9MW63_HEVBR|nr:hypothetical protein P3X46_007434 [Hevea brasiliensis]